MNVFFIILIVLIVLVSIIWILWKYESKIPELKFDNYDNIYKCIEDWLNELNQKKKFNGIALLIKNNQVLFELTLGYRNYEKKEKIDINTSFRLASVSKQFTAFGIMLLVKKSSNQINYDSLIIDFVENFPLKNVTIRNLLNHTSGISVEYSKLAYKNKLSKDYILTTKDATDLLCSNLSEKKSSIKKYFYCNSNYVILARLIELVSHKSFEKYMSDEVFIPLNLKNTFVWNLKSEKPLSSISNVATGFESYLNSKPKKIEPNWIDGVAGDGGVFSSLTDLKKWLLIWKENKLLTKAEMSEAFKNQMLENESRVDYGFGWVLKNNIIWHNGKWLAANSVIIKDLKMDLEFVMIDNSSNIRFDKISNNILNLIFKNYGI